MNPYNVLYLHNKSLISGGERSLLNLWRNLDRDSFIPHLMIPEEGEFSKAADQLNVDIFYHEVPKIKIEYFPQLKKSFSAIRNYIKKHHIKLIHSYSPRNNMMGTLVARVSGIPIIWHERNLVINDEPDHSRRFHFLPDRIICNSAAIAERFRFKKRIDRKVRVILNGVDLDKFKPGEKDIDIVGEFNLIGKKTVGIVTNLHTRKRVEFFIEAAAMISALVEDVHFIIVGSEFPQRTGDRLKILTDRVNQLGLGDKLSFASFRNDVDRILSVFYISTHVTKKEACSRAIMEAMASGKPVVGMSDGGNRELIADGITGFLVDPEDIEGFVKAVVKLLTNEPLRNEMSLKSREVAEQNFNVRDNAAKTEALYREVIK